jgi:hypothetical protein
LTAESEELRKESDALVAHSKLLLSQFAAELKLPKEKKDKASESFPLSFKTEIQAASRRFGAVLSMTRRRRKIDPQL